MSGKRAREVRRRKASAFDRHMRQRMADARRRLGMRRRDMRRLAKLPRFGVHHVTVHGRRTVAVKLLPWRVEFDAPGRPQFPRACRELPPTR